jgi:general stress protein 26
MNIHPQTNPERSQLATLIEDMSMSMLTAHDEHGHLTSRPMAPLEMDSHGALWFFTDKHSAKAKHLHVINLAFSDEDNSTYVSICGRGDLVDDRAMIERMWTEFARPWFPDGADSPNLVLLKITPNTAEYWDAPNSKMVRMFAMAASIVTGKPVGLGDNDTLTGLSDPATTVNLGRAPAPPIMMPPLPPVM